MEKDVYAVLQLEAEEKEMQQSEAQVRLCGGLWFPGSLGKHTALAPLKSFVCKQIIRVPSIFGNSFLQLPRYILSDAGSMAGTLLLSPQINTAKRLLEKGKEAQNHEPERSWFQTKEERKKEKSMSGGSSEAKHRIHRTQQFHSLI